MNVELSRLRLTLADFTLEVNAVLAGRVTAVFGASGAGKTTLLEIIAGLRRPTAGVVRIGDTTLTDVGNRTLVPVERRAVGYVPQDGALFPHLSVRQNLTFGSHLRAASLPGLTFGHVVEVLEIAALTDRAINTLSGGEKQRVALGRALLASPRLLLLDEPFAGLDASLRDRLLPYFIRVRDEFSIPMIYVTHSPDEVMALCDDVLLLERGRVGYQGLPAGIFVPATGTRYMLAR